ncbi:TetR/AcrR family transcriptional regulator [Nocardioides sp. Iso805N]|uniref:TetR/AcrR family transcriptional regulator n=1 Tax=Nocardioides sp. Iso805N TaxID=1283287 RepID=UPI0003817F24|nr:TetR/AcrR family transcriptional regulator [Nocardioides sp. Iso805N]
MTEVRRNARGEASLRRIMEATVDLLGRYGYDNTTIARITKATGRPASSIYWHFDNKDELIAASLEAMYRSPSASSPTPHWPAYVRGTGLREQLEDQLADELQSSPGEAPLRLAIMLALEGAAAKTRIQEPFQSRRAAVRRSLASWWQEAFEDLAESRSTVSAEQMASLLLVFLDSHYLSDSDTDADLARQRGTLLATSIVGLVLREDTATAHGGSMTVEDVDANEPPLAASAQVGVELLRVTRDLVAEYGYEGATMGRICEAAGVRKSSVYWRFKDKEALVEAAVSQPYVDVFGHFERLPSLDAARGTTWTDAVTGAVTVAVARILAAFENEPALVKAGLLLKAHQRGAPSTAILEGSAQVQSQLTGWLEQALAADGRSPALAPRVGWMVWRLTEGSLLGAALGPSLRPNEVVRLARPLLISALKAE